jgi:hypothetical protein
MKKDKEFFISISLDSVKTIYQFMKEESNGKMTFTTLDKKKTVQYTKDELEKELTFNQNFDISKTAEGLINPKKACSKCS